MARKSKRMAFNEAIRQGQAKIAESLKTGQIRPDDSDFSKAENEKGSFSRPKSGIQPPVKCRMAFSNKEKFIKCGSLSQKTKLIALFCVASIAVLSLVIWFILLVVKSQPEGGQTQGTAGIVSGEDESGKAGRLSDSESPELLGSVSRDSSEKESGLSSSKGDNVIWIQSIAFNRKEELNPLADFFRRKKIDTEVIAVDGPSGRLAVLVTRVGFEQNPAKEGTEGYELVQRIKQLGPVYVEETKDMKFGVKPFQDVYGYKR